jgi:hypothetical protein
VAGKLENFDAVIALEQQYCSLFWILFSRQTDYN